MTTQQLLTPHQSQYFAWLLTRRAAGDSVESLASTLVDSQVDLNPHQVEAALFACRNPLSRGVIRKQERQNPFLFASGPIICSYQFAKAKADDVKGIDWDLVVLDEAHRLRNVYKTSNVIAKTLKEALSRVHSKVLLTATPLQNSLLELYGLVSFIDDRVFGDLDSFRSQFTGREQSFSSLRDRLAPICKRTLRKQVQPYVSYTARRAIVEEFTPSGEEQELSRLVADYLRRPNLKALPDGQRQLISLVLWKLLASSTHAIAGALETMAKRLQGVLNQAPVVPDLAEELDEDYESLDETADEWEDQEPGTEATNRSERDAIAQEIEELRHFKTLATNIRDNAKGKALLTALVRAFAELDRLGAARKAIIFTESRRTQEYLLSLLADTPYGDGIVLFNGTNSDQRAQAIYKDWLKRHEGTDRITGSKTADTRAALVEHFKERGKVMIATEAGAEGINLQFCSLVINYDLPWNPQRIEQRIGRCHRYGQKFDVVVVNFVDRSNEADARVYELLSQKFQLFEGVFGASDEVLGAIGSGVDFERRIAEIYQNCREPEEIKSSFEQLQLDLSGEINEAMVKTRQVLLENFDEEVQEKLRMRADDSRNARNRFERMLMDLTRAELVHCAAFDDDGFDLRHIPTGIEHGGLTGIELGRYELPRRSGDAHLYRINHPLARWGIEQAKARVLDGARLVFDYNAYGSKISTLEAYRGKAGWLTVKLISVETFGKYVALPRPRRHWKKSCHGRRSSANWKASAASCAASCLPGRTKSKRNEMTSSVSWKCSSSSRWKSARCLPSNGSWSDGNSCRSAPRTRSAMPETRCRLLHPNHGNREHARISAKQLSVQGNCSIRPA